MKILGLDNKQYNWHPSKNCHPRLDPSKYHLIAKKLLEESFPFENVYEEVNLPGSSWYRKDLSADFFVPNKNIVVEVHGRQHYIFIEHFHRTKVEFRRALARDKCKKQWCELNSIKYVVFAYNETVDDWKRKISDE
jgi:hypothetical protein